MLDNSLGCHPSPSQQSPLMLSHLFKLSSSELQPSSPSLVSFPSFPEQISNQCCLQGPIELGLPSAAGFPPLPALPTTDLPTIGLPLPTTGTVSSPADIVSQLSSIQGQITTVTSILNTLPAGTSVDQLKQALAIASQIRSLAAPIVDRIQALGRK